MVERIIALICGGFYNSIMEKKAVKEIIASNISELRKREKMTQADLANRLDYSDKAISKWERGESLPDAEMLYRLARLFDVEVGYLFESHEYLGLSIEETKDLQRREIRTKIIVGLSIFALVLTIAGVIFASLADLLRFDAGSKFYFLFIPIVPAVFLLVNALMGQRKYNILLVSAIIWSSAISFYIYFRDYHLELIFSLAVIFQLTLIFFPKISDFYRKKLTAKEISDKKNKTGQKNQ